MNKEESNQKVIKTKEEFKKWIEKNKRIGLIKTYKDTSRSAYYKSIGRKNPYITEENYLVFAEIHALMTHVKRINKYPKTYNRYYQTSESWHEQTPTTKKEQHALEQLYKSVLSQNYTWREAREISSEVSKLNIYENYKFPHIIEEIKEAFDMATQALQKLEQIENGDTPDGYTWHHNEECGKT